MRRELITDLLDTLGLLLLAAGGAAALFPLVRWACLLLAGVVLLAGSAVASRQPRGKATAPR